MSSVFRTRADLESFEGRLRDGAASSRRAPPPGLRERILAGVRARPGGARTCRGLPPWVWLAAAALLLVGAGAWLLRDAPDAGGFPADRTRSVVSLSRELLGAGTRVLDLPAVAEGNLRIEARNLLIDASRAAEGVVRGLPAPLRAPLERM